MFSTDLPNTHHFKRMQAETIHIFIYIYLYNIMPILVLLVLITYAILIEVIFL